MRRFQGALVGLVLTVASGCPAPTSSPTPSPAPTRQRAELVPVGDMPVVVQEKLGELAALQDPTKALALVAVLEPQAKQSADLSDYLEGICGKFGAVDRALPLSRQAVRLAPKSATVVLHLGQLEQSLGDSQSAGEHLSTAATLAPDVPEIHIALARFKERELHTAEAEAEYREAVALDPQNPGLLGYLADNLINQQKYDEARKALAQADRFAPDAPPGLTQRAVIAREEARRGLGTREAKWAEATQLLERCLSVAPGYPAALYVQGSVLLDQGKEKEACAALEAAFAANPQQEGLRVLLGQLLVRQGEAARGLALVADHRRQQEHKEAFERLASRVAMKPADRARRQELIRWCLANGEPARARLEQSALATATAPP